MKTADLNTLYSISRRLLFTLDPERAHRLSLSLLYGAYRLGLLNKSTPAPLLRPVKVMGIEFPNPVGLAAGFDKNGAYIDPLSTLGFGFLEVGTVTPRPQPGNRKPRLFRLTGAQAIINRMGFNNHGTERLLRNVKQSAYRGILGISIGKNSDTPVERAAEDYLTALEQVYEYASYVALNISSPGTPNLRQLQRKNDLAELLATLKTRQLELFGQYGNYVPLVVKIAPDLSLEEIQDIAETLIEHDLDGVIATNSTLSREGVEGLKHCRESGGLSGSPLSGKATTVLRRMNSALAGKIPIIASGGVMSAEDARDKLNAGASLVQLYSGLVYRGPGLLDDIFRLNMD